MPNLIRFMSTREAVLLLRGDRLTNTSRHQAHATNSVGFCFATCEDGEGLVTGIHARSKELSGITDMDICLTGTLAATFKKAEGRYVGGYRDEFCTIQYALSDFKNWTFYTPEPHPAGIIRLLSRSSHDWKAPTRTADHITWRFPNE